MSSIVESLQRRKAELAAQAAKEWPVIVAGCLDGTPDPDKLLHDLERMGRTAGELDEAMGLLAQRRAWAAAIPVADAATKDLAGAQAKLDALEAEFAKVLAAHELKVSPLREGIRVQRSLVGEGDHARRELRRTAGAELADQLEVIVQRTNELATDRNRAEHAVEAGLANVEQWKSSTSPRAETELAAREDRLAELRAKLDDIGKAETALEAERLKLVTQTLLP